MADGDAIAAAAEPTLAKSRRRRTGKSGRSRHFDILLDVARRISGPNRSIKSSMRWSK